MDFIDDLDYLTDEFVDDIVDDYEPKKTKVNCKTKTLNKMNKADNKSMKTCAECNKKFLARLSCGLPWQYQDFSKGKKRWYCSYTCLSRSRKARKNGK